MKRTICFLFILLVFCNGKSYGEKILIAGLSEYPPYYYHNAQGKWVGMSLEILRKVAQRAGCRVKVIDIPWSRAFKYMEVGEIDLLLNVTKTKEREKFMDFIGLCCYEQMALIVKKENLRLHINSLEDIKKFSYRKFGIQKDYYYPQITERLKKDIDFRKYFEVTVNSEINIKKALGGRILGFFENIYFVKYAGKINPEYRGLSVHTFTLSPPLKVNIAASIRTDRKIRERLKESHRYLLSKGYIEKVMKKWGR